MGCCDTRQAYGKGNLRGQDLNGSMSYQTNPNMVRGGSESPNPINTTGNGSGLGNSNVHQNSGTGHQQGNPTFNSIHGSGSGINESVKPQKVGATGGNSSLMNSSLTSSGLRVKPFKPINHPLYQGELGQASKLFYEQEYAEAAEIFREYIEKHLKQIKDQAERKQKPEILQKEANKPIDGVGQVQLSLGYYEWFLFRYYKEGIESNKFIGTVYDALSLCYQALKTDENQIGNGIKWYMNMVDNYPDHHALIMGYANILNNKGIFEEALDYYGRVLDLQPRWVRPLECIAYIYEYKRINKKLSVETANKLLSFEPNNRVGLFVLARNEANTDKKIEKLKEVGVKHPDYARAFNETGIIYGGTKKDYREAIFWYQKALQATPEYASSYNNVGVNYELLKDDDEAIMWYFKGIQKDKEYKAPHKNFSDIVDSHKMTDAKIQEHMAKYNIKKDYFYYYMGLSYHDKKKDDLAIKYYMKAYDCLSDLNKHIYKLHNSVGIAYDQMKKNQDALKYYTKCIGANPKYHSAYYNMAIVYKRQNNIDQAINWYKKAIEVNPRYSYAYNNLANIYKNKKNYEEAVKYYKLAVKHLSTYTLALANMGVCCLQINNFREAFNSMERAKECLPTDNNNLSEANKKFLKETLANFDKEGESWRQNGCVTPQQRAKLKNLIKNFESNFNKVDDAKAQMSRDRVLKPQILEIVRLVHQDEFSLKNIDRIYDIVKTIFEDNEEHFHIVPQLFMQFFYKNAFSKDRSVLSIENQLKDIVQRLSNKTVAGIKTQGAEDNNGRKTTFKMNHFNPPTANKVNLFKPEYFNSYEEIYGEIMHVNQEAGGAAYQEFNNLVGSVRRGSYGQIYGIGMKIPKDESQQFKVILRIFEKMFKNELTPEKVKQIIEKLDAALRAQEKASKKHLVIADVMKIVMSTWTKEITEMVVDRKQKKIPTKCEVSDLIRAKIMYESVDHLRKGITVIDDLCNIKGYKVIEMDNRLAKATTQDVVFKVQIRGAVCELQLAIQQEATTYHFSHCIYEIVRSPLGCIFGSYIYMSKGFQYPFLENCKDIVKQLSQPEGEMEKKTLAAAKYVVDNLNDDLDVNQELVQLLQFK